MMIFFLLSFFPRDVLDEISDLIESVSEGFPIYYIKRNDWQTETVSEPRLRQQAGIEKPHTAVKRDILVQ